MRWLKEKHWERERYQRDCILRGLFDLNHEADYILISDLDEIPNISSLDSLVRSYSSNVLGYNFVDMFYYSADNQMYKDGKPLLWDTPKLIRPSSL